MNSRTAPPPIRKSPPRRRLTAICLVIVMLLFASLACMRQTDTLNQGRGTRDDPVTALQFARTRSYNIRGMNVTRPMTFDHRSTPKGYEYIGVEYEVLCTRGSEEICDLDAIADGIKLVSSTGHLFSPVDNLPVDNPLSGEILGNARKIGRVVYQTPINTAISTATVAFKSDSADLVFFKLP